MMQEKNRKTILCHVKVTNIAHTVHFGFLRINGQEDDFRGQKTSCLMISGLMQYNAFC